MDMAQPSLPGSLRELFDAKLARLREIDEERAQIITELAEFRESMKGVVARAPRKRGAKKPGPKPGVRKPAAAADSAPKNNGKDSHA